MDKAVWDDVSTEVLINTCIDQIYKKERNGLVFTKTGWMNIVTTFNEKTGRGYGIKQLKNRLDILKKDLRTWDKLVKEIGASRDAITNVVSASNEWWQQKIQANKDYKKFRHTTLKFENKIRIISKDVVATREDMFSPSFTQPHAQDEDVYCASMDEEEGSGDSEDDQFGANLVPNIGVTNDLASIDLLKLSSPVGPTTSGSHSKRKRGEGSVQRKKMKVLPFKQIADAFSIITTVSKDRAAILNDISSHSVQNVMSELFALEEIQRDEDFRNQCMLLLRDKTNREMFVSVKGNKEYLLSWLRFMVRLP